MSRDDLLARAAALRPRRPLVTDAAAQLRWTNSRRRRRGVAIQQAGRYLSCQVGAHGDCPANFLRDATCSCDCHHRPEAAREAPVAPDQPSLFELAAS